jgi:hypothetical protein
LTLIEQRSHSPRSRRIIAHPAQDINQPSEMIM